jgi:hypothetical protein
MVYSGAWGKLIHEKNQKQKISWHCPFNVIKTYYMLKCKQFDVNNQHKLLGSLSAS